MGAQLYSAINNKIEQAENHQINMKTPSMKKILAVAFAAVASVSFVHAQGTIQFDNFGGGVDAPISDVSGTPIDDTTGNYIAGLWIASGAGQSVDSLVDAGLTSSFAGFGGYFLGGSQTLAGYAAGSVVTVQVRAQNTTTGDSGGSNLIDVTLGGLGQPPSTPGLLAGLEGFQLVAVPEPSTIALAGLGIAGLLALRRRRS